jgi:hypothetical protein
MFDLTTAGFRKHQSTVWAANELRNVYLNLCCGIMNLTIVICLLVQVSDSTLPKHSAAIADLSVQRCHHIYRPIWCVNV